MRLKRFILLVAGLVYACCASAQIQGEYVQSRILILLDESSSMIQGWASGKPKYKAAHDIIMQLMDSVYAVNNQVQFGLRVFGHQHTVPENDCYDTKNEVAFSTDNRNQMYLRLEDIHPLGVTPIAFALKEAAAKDLVDEGHNAYSIILITDGGESCGGDICEVMKSLVSSKVYFKPYIVSLENDPTLKTTYSCMGDFLQVTREADIPKAVKTIVDAFKPILKIKRTEYEVIQTNVIKKWKVPAPELVPAMYDASDPKLLAITTPKMRKLPLRDEPVHLPRVVVEQPKPETITRVVTADLKVKDVPAPTEGKIREVKVAAKLPPVVAETPVLPKAEKLERLKLGGLRQFNVIFVIEEHTYSPKPVPRLPPVKAEKPVAVAKPPEKKEEPKHEFKVETVDNDQTTVEVYFTNGEGKFYTTSPQVMLVDPKTNQPVRKFFRYVGPDGNPDPQTGIPAGTYDLTFANNRGFVLPNVVIQANKKNKIMVVVKSTSLSFAYKEPPNTVIKEGWTATVTERNKTQGRVQDQKMTEQIKYEPGNYHIEINTFPREIRNVDLDFDNETVITIDHPGFAKFVPTDAKTQSVVLYQRLGDKFLAFYTVDLNDPRSQHLSIQPNEYQAHFQKGPGSGYGAEKVVTFRVKPNEETVVELK